jgi:hypothetical protein
MAWFSVKARDNFTFYLLSCSQTSWIYVLPLVWHLSFTSNQQN